LHHVLVRAFAETTWMPEDSDPTDPRHGLLKMFQTLADQLRGEAGQPRDIAARPRKAADEPARHRIGSTSEDNGDGPGRLLGGQGRGWVSSHDDINLERNQFGRKSGKPLELPLGVSLFTYDDAAQGITQIRQSLTEGLVHGGQSGQVVPQPAYSSDLGRLLGLADERRKNEAENNRESDPPHGHLGGMAGGESSRSQQPGSVVLLMSAPGVSKPGHFHRADVRLGSPRDPTDRPS